MLDVKPNLHFTLYSYVSVWHLQSMNTLLIAHVLEALERIASYIKIATGI